MKIIQISLVVAAIFALFSGSASADTIADLVTAEIARSDTPGIAIAVVDDGHVTRVQGFGLADLEHGVPVHADTMFKTGATGMQFTAAATMLLVEDGKIDLDAPVGRYLPKAPAKWGKVTIRQLLGHVSGMPATPNGDFRAEYSSAELLAIIAGEDMNFAPGAHWRFSYAGYIVLGFVIEAVTGEHWTQFVGERLFAPLGMTTAREIDDFAIIPNRSTGYELRNGTLRNAEWISRTANSTADGSLYLSALDYAAWAQALSRHLLLRPESWQVLETQARLTDGTACSYVPGWAAAATGSRTRWTQLGSWQGFQAYTLRYPARDLTVAVYANGEGADVRRLARAIAGATDASLVAPRASPRTDADADATARARRIIEDIAIGKARPDGFADYAKLDFSDLAGQYAGMLGGLGALGDLALFDRARQCGAESYVYRARFARGMVEARMDIGPDGRIVNIDIVPISQWDEPL